MSIQKLKVGIAGYGIVGKRRRHYIDLHEMLTTVAVCDQKFNAIESTEDGVRAYKNYEDMLECEKLDILFVCLPNYLASIATISGLKKGLHVFCEKPPGRNLEDIATVIRTHSEFSNQKLMYGFNHRYHDSVREALKVVRSNEMGRVLNLRGVYGKSVMVNFENDWRTQRSVSGGGILLDQGIHMLDLMRLFAGEFEDFKSFISNDYWGHDVEDNAYAIMRTKSGVVGMLHSSATQWRHRFHLEIALEEGTINLSGILSGTKSYGAETITISRRGMSDKGDPKETTIRYNEDNSWKDEIWDFTDSILSGKHIEVGSAADAFKTMELVYKIYCADESWKSKYQLSDKI